MENKNIGILDPEGKELNPLTGKSYSERYKELAKKWSTFPVYKRAKEIIKDIEDYQVLLIQAQTGSGKSVLVVKYVLHVYNYDAKIAMTLPKQIITKATAEFAAETLDVKLGEEVGYQYKGSPSNAKSDKTKLLFCTDGTVMQRLLKDPYLKDFDCVIIDESHERSTRIDFLLYLLRETLRLRPEFKLIIMSATVNAEIFKNYYQEFKFKQIDVGGGRTFPITEYYVEKSLQYNDTINEGFNKLITILEQDDPTKSGAHDIIFFITSSNDAFNLCKRLNQFIEKEKKTKCRITCKGDIYCVEVYSGMDEKKQLLAQDKSLYKENTTYNRKIVIATNVAESSLTIDGIKYVIDTGYELKSSFDPEYRARKLERQLISQAQSKQRCGRGGRTEPGECHKLYTKNDYENIMIPFPEPEIRTSDITAECLNLLSIEKIGNVPNLIETLANFIEPPREINIRIAINTLMQLGLIEKDVVTKIGKLVNEIPLNDILFALTFVYSKIYRCSNEILKIYCMIDASKANLNDIYRSPTDILQNKKADINEEQFRKMLSSLNNKFDSSRKKLMSKYGDHLTLLKIFDKFSLIQEKYKENQDKLNDWGHDNFLKLNTLMKAKKNYKKIRWQINSLFKNQPKSEDYDLKHFNEIEKLNVDERVLSCLLLGFRLNTAVKIFGSENYRTQHSKNLKINLNKLSTLNLHNQLPKNVIYYELFISMGKNDINIISVIPKEILNILS